MGSRIMAGGREYREIGYRAAVFHRCAVDLGVGEQGREIVARFAATLRHQIREITVKFVEHDFPGTWLLFRMGGVGARSAQIGVGPTEQPLRQFEHARMIRARHTDDIEHHLKRIGRGNGLGPVEFATGGTQGLQLRAGSDAYTVGETRHTL